MVPTLSSVRRRECVGLHHPLTCVNLGEVVDGMDIVKKIESLGSASGTPKARIVIANSGTV